MGALKYPLVITDNKGFPLKNVGDLECKGVLDASANPAKMKIYESPSQPTIPSGTSAIWHDTGQSKYWLISNIAGKVNLVEISAADIPVLILGLQGSIPQLFELTSVVRAIAPNNYWWIGGSQHPSKAYTLLLALDLGGFVVKLYKWDGSLTLIKTFDTPPAAYPIFPIGFSPDGSYALMGTNQDAGIWKWDHESQTISLLADAPVAGTNCRQVCYSPVLEGGFYTAAILYRNKVDLYNPSWEGHWKTIDFSEDPAAYQMSACDWTPDGTMIVAVGNGSSSNALLDLDPLLLTYDDKSDLLAPHNDVMIYDVAWKPSGDYCVIVGDGPTVFCYDLVTATYMSDPALIGLAFNCYRAKWNHAGTACAVFGMCQPIELIILTGTNPLTDIAVYVSGLNPSMIQGFDVDWFEDDSVCIISGVGQLAVPSYNGLMMLSFNATSHAFTLIDTLAWNGQFVILHQVICQGNWKGRNIYPML
jgi:WD40 repeat protein